MDKKMNWVIALVTVLALGLLTGYATMFRTREANVVAASGATSYVQILRDSMVIYYGALPATFSPTSQASYTVVFTKVDGESETIAISRVFNTRFIGNLLIGGILGIIIDVATGNVMMIPRTTTLPIVATSPTITLVEHIPDNHDWILIGNINDAEEPRNHQPLDRVAMGN